MRIPTHADIETLRTAKSALLDAQLAFADAEPYSPGAVCRTSCFAASEALEAAIQDAEGLLEARKPIKEEARS